MKFVCGLVGDKMRELEKERNKVQSMLSTEKQQELIEDERIVSSICKRYVFRYCILKLQVVM